MQMSIHFPNLGIYFERVEKTVSIFQYQFRIYQILLIAALLLGMGITVYLVIKTEQDLNFYLIYLATLLTGGTIGARIFYCVLNWEVFVQKPLEILNLLTGGMSYYGAILGGSLAGWLICRKQGVSFSRAADTSSIGLLAGQIIGVWGHFFNRESLGRYTDCLFAMQIPAESVRNSKQIIEAVGQQTVKDGVVYIQVHPLFLYQCLWFMFLMMILLIYRKYCVFEGELFLVYLTGYSVSVFASEMIRADALMLGNTKISVSQTAAGMFLVLGIVFMSVKHTVTKARIKRDRHRKAADEEALRRFKEEQEKEDNPMLELEHLIDVKEKSHRKGETGADGSPADRRIQLQESENHTPDRGSQPADAEAEEKDRRNETADESEHQ